MSDDERWEKISDCNESEHEVVTARWQASEPPEEVFTSAETNKEWHYDIIGEDIDENGNVFFEVRWDDWARRDGTKTTWSHSTAINGDYWKKKQRKSRSFAARESLEIELVSTIDIHNFENYLAHQAHQEKTKISDKLPKPNLLSELTKIQAKHQDHERARSSNMQTENQGLSSSSYPKRNSQRESTRQKSEISLANSVRGTSASSRPSTCSVPPVTSNMKSNSSRSTTIDSNSSLSATSFQKGKLRAHDSDEFNVLPSFMPDLQSPCSPKKARLKQIIRSDSEDETEGSSATPRDIFNRMPKRRRLSTDPAAQRSELSKEWTMIAAQQKAASITFVNIVDSESVPHLPPGFLYLESGYQFSSGVPQPAHMEGFLVKCSSRYCVDVSSCECQAASTLIDENGIPMLAYDSDGHFAFNVPQGTEVVECNKLCECSLKSCRNRVSQRPRDIPVEIFKTESRGWGVRPLINVNRGKVLGLYTGLVVPRESAHSLPEHLNSHFVFDLDGDEDGEDNPLPHPLFSVDSRTSGNWTRFINHSCSPNLQIYLVVHDIPPANGLPFIAFVAMRNIPAKTEFTFDYDPRAAARMAVTKETTFPEGAKICNCGTKACRGVLS